MEASNKNKKPESSGQQNAFNRVGDTKTTLNALYQISELSSEVTSLDILYPELHKIISSLVPADNFYIGLLDRAEQTFEFAYFVDPHDKVKGKVVPYSDIEKGISAYVINKKVPMLFEREALQDLKEQGEISPIGTMPESWVGVPLVQEKEAIGIIAVQSYNESLHYTEQDKELLAYVARQIISSIAKVKQRHLMELIIEEKTKALEETATDLRDEVKKRRNAQEFQAALLEIAELANQNVDINKFYQHIHQLLSQFLNTENYYVALVDEEHQKLTFPYYSNEFDSKLGTRKLAKGLTEYVIDKSDCVLLSNQEILALEADGDIDIKRHKTAQDRHALSWLGCPLKVAGKVIGVINVQSYREDAIYQQEDMKLLKFASHHIALAISNKLAAEKLLIQQSELERKILQRTADLQNTNEALQNQIDERKKVEEQLFFDAHHDALTGLPNRLMLQEAIKRAIAHKCRDKKAQYAILFIDLDRFKLINDTLGHHAGDEFLIEVANRIASCIREQDLLARLGGDEFVILLTAFETEVDCEDVASRIIDAIAEPFLIDEQQVYSGASIGVAPIHSNYEDQTEVLRDADAAMYHAKNLGRGRYALFNANMHASLVEEMEMEQQLRQAIQTGKLETYLQPITKLADGDVIGYESFVRWHHPKRGLLEFEEFSKTAEDSGLAVRINLTAIEQACALLKQWQYQGGVEKNYRIYVNISSMHFSQTHTIEEMIKLIKESGVNPFNLVLEIDEATLSKSADDAYQGIKALKKIGVKVAMDNFGSGLASLNYLYNYPFDYVKVDKRFVKNIHSSNKHFMLIMSAQSVATHIGFKLIAQGVESSKQVQQLLDIKCEYGQGKYLGDAKILQRSSDTENSDT